MDVKPKIFFVYKLCPSHNFGLPYEPESYAVCMYVCMYSHVYESIKQVYIKSIISYAAFIIMMREQQNKQRV